MNQEKGNQKKSPLLLAFLMMVLAALACKSPGIAVERIVCKNNGGEWVVPTTEYSGWCRYPYDEDIEESNSRMATLEAEFLPDGDTQEGNVESQGEAGIPAGAYVGTSNYPEVLVNSGWFTDGNFTFHEVTINVTDDGSVTGSYLLHIVGEHQTDFDYLGKKCTGYAEADITGIFHGQLTGSSGTIESTENWVCNYYYDCDMMDLCSTDEPYYREFEILLNSGNMTGTTLPWPEDTDGIWVWVFNVVKQ